MSNNFSFYLPELETRSVDIKGIPTYIVRGYAAIPNHVYTYKHDGNRPFKEFFSERALKSLKEKAKAQKVFADVEHFTGTKESSIHLLKNMKGQGNDSEIDYLISRLQFSDLPMFKVHDINIDDTGFFVEIHGNPFYRDYDADHKSRFDATWSSLEKKFINGMSVNFKPTQFIKIDEETMQIDDLDLYGISLTGSPANEKATITEVAMRSLELMNKTERGVETCPTTRRMMLLA